VAHVGVDHRRLDARAPRVVEYRDELLTLPKLDLAAIDAFADYARALRCVQIELWRWMERGKLVPELAKEGWSLRSQMLAYADALSYRGRVAPELGARLRRALGTRTSSQTCSSSSRSSWRSPRALLILTTDAPTGATVSTGHSQLFDSWMRPVP
jgi:hypothetical protein